MQSGSDRLTRVSWILVFALSGLQGLAAPEGPQSISDRAPTQTVTGVVFADKNASGVFDEGDVPLEGIRVSNGRKVVLTDAQGRYALPMEHEGVVFVIKPRNYQAPLNEYNLPQFYYLHRPKGSPATRFAGIAPTGPLPASVDFALTPTQEPDEFNVIIFGDPQPRNTTEIDYMLRKVVEELVAQGVSDNVSFGISLGDIVFDDLGLFAALNAAIAQIGLPWINVLGNHDCNFDAPALSQSYETFQRIYGPAYYAFDYGPAHFVVLNTVTWHEGDNRRYYRGGLGQDQLAFVANNLAHVPKDALVVFVMHIPFIDSTAWNAGELQAFYRIIEDRPHTLSFAAHTHSHKHRFLDPSNGWQGSRPHHHVIHGTICGAWWSGPMNEYAVPQTLMADGTPHGYGILTIKGNTYRHRYKVFGRDEDFQMHIHAPETVTADAEQSGSISANIFNAWADAEVSMRIGRNGTWLPMQHKHEPDPVFLDYRDRHESVPERYWRNPPQPRPCRHIWSTPLGKLPEGTHLIEIKAVNPDGQMFRGVRIIRAK